MMMREAMKNHVATAASAVQAKAKPSAPITKVVSGLMLALTAIVLILISQLSAQSSLPDWCRLLPHPEYKTLEPVPISDPWYEVYKPAPGVFAIYEPHQSEESTPTGKMILFLAYKLTVS